MCHHIVIWFAQDTTPAARKSTQAIRVVGVVRDQSNAIPLHGIAVEVVSTKQVITDNMDAQEMKANGDADAAAAMSRVTGLSLVDNQYVFVRGLGERYGNTTLAAAPHSSSSASISWSASATSSRAASAELTV